MAQTVKNLPEMQEALVQSLGWEDPLEKGMTTHSSILAQRISCTEELGGLQSMSLQRVGQDWVTNTFTSISRCRNPRNKWHSIPYNIKEASYFFFTNFVAHLIFNTCFAMLKYKGRDIYSILPPPQNTDSNRENSYIKNVRQKSEPRAHRNPDRQVINAGQVLHQNHLNHSYQGS